MRNLKRRQAAKPLVIHPLTPSPRRKGARATNGYAETSNYDEAKQPGWIVISMKNDWKRIFAFDK